LDGCIGRGGVTEVWVGHHARHPQALMVKVWNDRRAHTDDDTLIATLQQGVGVSDAGLLEVLDVGRVRDLNTDHDEWFGDEPYVLMERALGGSIRGLGGSLSLSVIGRLADTLLSALGALHTRGMVHGHLKPTNVLLMDTTARDSLRRSHWPTGRVKLADAGQPNLLVEGDVRASISSAWQQDAAAYLAPEQLEHAPRWWTPTTDLFSLGSLIYSMIEGQPPFTVGNVGQTIQALLTCDVDEPEHQVMTDDMFEWLMRLLASDPSERPSSAFDARKYLRVV